MDFSTLLQPGLKAEKIEAVNEKNTAQAWGSGGLPVYATPAMVALMEGAALAAVQPLLPPGWSSVGTALDIKHISPTPQGLNVRAAAELLETDGRRLVFKVEAFDEAGRIGEGTHSRFIIEDEKFMTKAEGRAEAPSRH